MIRSLFRRKSKEKNPMGSDFNLVADESAQTPTQPNSAANPLIKSTTLPPINLPITAAGNLPAQPAAFVAVPAASTAPTSAPSGIEPAQVNHPLASGSVAQPVPLAPFQPTTGQGAIAQPVTEQSIAPEQITPEQIASEQIAARQAAAQQAAVQQKIRPSTASGGPALIRMDNVTKAYETPNGPFMALKEIDLRIGTGEFVAVVGKSGSGKSTLINMITGIDRPTTGEIQIADTAIHNLGEGPMAEWRGRNVGVIFQFFQLLPMLTCVENVMLPMDFCKMYKPSERRKRALDLLDMVEMKDQADKLPSEVSGGQQQRVAIARALSNDPPVIVADEPTGNLDSKTADAVFQMFERLINEGKTILMVTHDDELADRVTRRITIADGVIVGEEQLR